MPPYILPLLCLSKRLHSIYILRLFNDCWTQFFLMSTCWLFTRRQWTAGTVTYALALGVKMNALLYFPGLMVVITLVNGLEGAIRTALRIPQIQVLLAIPFRMYAKSYVTKAFDFGRSFLWQWTVNWRFVREDIFLSREFAWSLLVGHFATLSLFVITRWLRCLSLRWQC